MYSIFIYLFNSTNLYSPQDGFTQSVLALFSAISFLTFTQSHASLSVKELPRGADAVWTDHQAVPAEELEVECLTQGHLDTSCWGIWSVLVSHLSEISQVCLCDFFKLSLPQIRMCWFCFVFLTTLKSRVKRKTLCDWTKALCHILFYPIIYSSYVTEGWADMLQYMVGCERSEDRNGGQKSKCVGGRRVSMCVCVRMLFLTGSGWDIEAVVNREESV